MRARIILVALGLLTGCASLTRDKNGKLLLPADVQRMVQCEFEDALRQAARSEPELKKWGGEYQIFLIVERRVGAGMSALDWVIPSGDGKFGLGIGIGATGKDSDTTLVTSSFVYTAGERPYCTGYEVSIPALKGRLGIAEWIDSAIDDPMLIPSSLGRTLEFVVTYDGFLRPSFGIDNLTGGFGVNAGRSHTHRLAVVMKEIKKPQPMQVVIVDSKGRKTVTTTAPTFSPSTSFEFLQMQPGLFDNR